MVIPWTIPTAAAHYPNAPPPLSLQLDQINLCIFYMGEKRRRECTFFGREATSADYIVRLSECIYRSSEHLFQVPFEFDVYIYIYTVPPHYHHYTTTITLSAPSMLLESQKCNK